jgi:endonuclease YncB( thermonuclease family)
LDGIDAPELGQPFGPASKQHLAELPASREAVAECSKTDRYRREVCRVLIGGADAGLEQIRAGMAWCFRRYAKELPPDRRQQYTDMEAQAQAGRRGLWTDGEPVPPWDWRAQSR